VSREHPLALHRVAIAVVVLLLTAIAFLAVRGPTWWQRMYYPLKHAGVIAEASAAHDVDPYLIAALINAESGFDADEVSHAGAVGLMQLMPETATAVAAGAGLMVNPDAEMLVEPALNVDLGTRHLAALLKRYRDTAVALAAYNAGEGSVDRWIGESGASSVIAAAYPETQRYVERVLRERNRYVRLYPDAFGDAPAGEGAIE
jgi:soluble lytic murein transglycosylase